MIRRLAVSTVLLVLAQAARAAEPAPGLSSPMVDLSLYRDGAVHRLTGHFGGWTVVCDEITALKQRYCSLKSAAARDRYGHMVQVDVSTGDDGKPAALLHLPLAVSVPFGVQVAASEPPPAPIGRHRKGAERALPVQHTVPIARCTSQECQAVLDLGPSELHSLDTGQALNLTYCATRQGLEFASDLGRSSCEVKLAGSLSGAGFRDAVQASMK